MAEPYYSIVCWGIRLSPAVFMFLVWILCYYRYVSIGWKLFATVAVGYLTGAVCVWGYWEFAARFAPTDAVADEILNKDGAPRLLAPLVIPFFVPFFLILMLPFAWIVTRLFPRTVLARTV